MFPSKVKATLSSVWLALSTKPNSGGGIARPGQTASASATSLKDVIIIVTEVFFSDSALQKQMTLAEKLCGDRGSVSY